MVQTDGRDSDMESRIRELETQVQNLQRDIQLLKSTGIYICKDFMSFYLLYCMNEGQ